MVRSSRKKTEITRIFPEDLELLRRRMPNLSSAARLNVAIRSSLVNAEDILNSRKGFMNVKKQKR